MAVIACLRADVDDLLLIHTRQQCSLKCWFTRQHCLRWRRPCFLSLVFMRTMSHLFMFSRRRSGQADVSDKSFIRSRQNLPRVPSGTFKKQAVRAHGGHKNRPPCAVCYVQCSWPIPLQRSTGKAKMSVRAWRQHSSTVAQIYDSLNDGLRDHRMHEFHVWWEVSVVWNGGV